MIKYLEELLDFVRCDGLDTRFLDMLAFYGLNGRVPPYELSNPVLPECLF